MSQAKVALITGASSGIGKEFARIQLATIPLAPKKMLLQQVRKMQEV